MLRVWQNPGQNLVYLRFDRDSETSASVIPEADDRPRESHGQLSAPTRCLGTRHCRLSSG